MKKFANVGTDAATQRLFAAMSAMLTDKTVPFIRERCGDFTRQWTVTDGADIVETKTPTSEIDEVVAYRNKAGEIVKDASYPETESLWPTEAPNARIYDVSAFAAAVETAAAFSPAATAKIWFSLYRALRKVDPREVKEARRMLNSTLTLSAIVRIFVQSQKVFVTPFILDKPMLEVGESALSENLVMTIQSQCLLKPLAVFQQLEVYAADMLLTSPVSPIVLSARKGDKECRALITPCVASEEAFWEPFDSPDECKVMRNICNPL